MPISFSSTYLNILESGLLTRFFEMVMIIIFPENTIMNLRPDSHLALLGSFLLIIKSIRVCLPTHWDLLIR